VGILPFVVGGQALEPEKGAGVLKGADVKVVSAIRAEMKKYDEALNKKDWDAVAKLYTKDVVRIPPNGPAQAGREEVMKHLKGLEFKDWKFESLEFYAAGDFAYELGSYSMTCLRGKSERGYTIQGNSMTLFRKDRDDSWRIFRETWSELSGDRDPGLKKALGR
jgi:uncharacterized protein (TIGR02246 family)